MSSFVPARRSMYDLDDPQALRFEARSAAARSRRVATT